jgi:hypothetical protein
MIRLVTAQKVWNHLHYDVVDVIHHKAMMTPAAAIAPTTKPLFSTCPAAPVEVAPDEIVPD